MRTFARHRARTSNVGAPIPLHAGPFGNHVSRQRHDLRQMLGGPRVQTKLRVSEPNDPLEREADRVADRVVASGPNGAFHQGALAGPGVQRMCAECEDEVATKRADTDTVHRQAEPADEEDEQVMTKRYDGADLQRQTEEPGEEEEEQLLTKSKDGSTNRGTADAAVASGIGTGKPLPAGLRSYFEPRFGQSFENVRIHTDGPANAASEDLNARAFTYGRDIAFASGEYQPDTVEGRRLMAHELAHTVQQGQNRRSVQRKVDKSKVDCRNPSKRKQRTVGKDPVATIAAADARAIKQIDFVISLLEAGRQKIIDGAPIAWPTLSDAVAVGLKKRFGLDYNDKAVWTGTGAGSVFILIERYKAVRNLLASGNLSYICLAPKKIKRSYYTGEGCAGEWAFAFEGENEMFLCKPWWKASTDHKATTLMHEAIHVVYSAIGDSGTKTSNAHCYEQYVADIHGISVPKAFKGSC
jgi:hypothetical protein